MSELLFTLKPSDITGAGVGCFATTYIQSGTRLAPPVPEPTRQLTHADIPDSHLKYCPRLESGLFLAPAHFAAMSVFWYINHARTPNVGANQWRLYASEDIQPNQELTIYYPDLLTHPKNLEWVVPEDHC